MTRIKTAMEAEPPMLEAERPQPASESIIQIHKLEKQYKGSKAKAVNEISFSVRRGEVFGLLGPNGAGKTTTISILTTRALPTGGEVLVDGLDVVSEAASVKQRIA